MTISLLLTLIIWCAIVGLIAWAVTAIIPMPPQVKTVIYVICGLALLLIVLQAIPGLNFPRGP